MAGATLQPREACSWGAVSRARQLFVLRSVPVSVPLHPSFVLLLGTTYLLSL
jgi:hypothetical protein